MKLLPLFVFMAATSGCQTAAHKPTRHVASSTTSSADFESTAFGKGLASAKLNLYFANLHAHHFMGIHGSKKNPITLDEALAPGPCKVEHGQFPMDDGRPCRDENGQENITIPPRTKLADGSPDLSDYFRQACEYATTVGELDILFITPHTKNNGLNEGHVVTSTTEDELKKRHDMLVEVNPDRLGAPKFLCGLGQEASSISTGNHINILGQFHADRAGEEPFFFPSGDFKTLYPAIKARNDAGGKIFLQLNHPDVKRDLYWGDFATFADNKRRKKEVLNDYGLDDFAPLGCLIGKLPSDTPECQGVAGDKLTVELLKKTFANIRAASGNPFRLIEVIPPGAAKEGSEESDGDDPSETPGTAAFSATTNPKTFFRPVHHRTSPDTYEEGIHDWIFYLSMGFKLGPTADQDNHHMNWGSATASRTGVLASDLKETTVLDALASRHVFASEDKNARILLSQGSDQSRSYMGDTIKTTSPTTKIQVSYFDPDLEDRTAKIRLYYYRANDVLDFAYRAESKNAYRTVSFDAKNRITLPMPIATGRSSNDLIPVRSGEVLTLDLPLTQGVQWVFAEIIQDKDFDKIWSAPIWIEKE